MTTRSVQLTLLLLAFLVLPLSALTAQEARITTPFDRLQTSERVDPRLLSDLRGGEAVRVTVHFVRAPADAPEYAGHPARDSDVGPLLFELVSMSQGFDSRLDDHGSVQAFTGRLGAGALASLLDDPYVLAIDRPEAAARVPARPARATADGGEGLTSISAASHICSASSTTACLQGNRFAVQVPHGGGSSRVAGTTSASAVFWTYSSTNWEVLVKVLDGCSANGYYWVFAAGATGGSYSFSVEDTANDLLIFFPGSCPVANTTAFPC